MNTWGYLLLIAALLLLAGVMLYARFASRSREKSLHHPPVDWEFSPMVISSAPALTEEIPLVSSEASEPSAGPTLRLERPFAAATTEPSRDRDYMDDLQEAAAGLAKLMRSSPVARVEPVVFAPEEVVAEEVVAEEAVADILEEETFVALVEVPVIEAEVLPVAFDEPVVSEEEPVSEEAEIVAGDLALQVVNQGATLEVAAEIEEIVEPAAAISEFPPQEVLSERLVTEDPVLVEEPVAAEIPQEIEAPRILSLRELLGETVADQFDRIDEGLDALESLVTGIESSLRELADIERGELDRESLEEEDAVAAAA
ncbi:MAG: hypothetical protein QE273_06630 [Verrucomicrobiales bacterium]|nr:hypothetical protein [Verrucomicrobiales bacterium]